MYSPLLHNHKIKANEAETIRTVSRARMGRPISLELNGKVIWEGIKKEKLLGKYLIQVFMHSSLSYNSSLWYVEFCSK